VKIETTTHMTPEMRSKMLGLRMYEVAPTSPTAPAPSQQTDLFGSTNGGKRSSGSRTSSVSSSSASVGAAAVRRDTSVGIMAVVSPSIAIGLPAHHDHEDGEQRHEHAHERGGGVHGGHDSTGVGAESEDDEFHDAIEYHQSTSPDFPRRKGPL
jgi:hypothetical protein